MAGPSSRTSSGTDWESPRESTTGSRSRWTERLVVLLVGLAAGTLIGNSLASSDARVTVHAAPLGHPAPVEAEPLPWREATAAYAITCENGAAVALNLRVDGLPADLSYASMFVPAGGSPADAVPATERVPTQVMVGRGTPEAARPASPSIDVPAGSLEIQTRFDEPPDSGSGLPALYAHYQQPGSPSDLTPIYWLPPEWWECDRRD